MFLPSCAAAGQTPQLSANYAFDVTAPLQARPMAFCVEGCREGMTYVQLKCMKGVRVHADPLWDDACRCDVPRLQPLCGGQECPSAVRPSENQIGHVKLSLLQLKFGRCQSWQRATPSNWHFLNMAFSCSFCSYRLPAGSAADRGAVLELRLQRQGMQGVERCE